MFDIMHVKGEGTYGSERTVPIPPDVRPILATYFLVRQKWLADRGCDSPALFVNPGKGSDFLSGNGIRKIKDIVQDDLQIRFDLRECRRTFDQRYLDRDLDVESTSVQMGHSSTRTTESFYGRRRNEHAIEKALRVLGELH